MEKRIVEFEDVSIQIYRQEDTDYVATRPILKYLHIHDNTNESTRLKKKFDTVSYVALCEDGKNKKCQFINFGYLETWLDSFFYRRSNFKKPDNSFFGRAKHAKQTLPGLIFNSYAIPESIEQNGSVSISSESKTSSNEQGNGNGEGEKSNGDSQKEEIALKPKVYSAVPTEHLCSEIDNAIAATTMQVEILLELLERLEEFKKSEFMLISPSEPNGGEN